MRTNKSQEKKVEGKTEAENRKKEKKERICRGQQAMASRRF